MNSDKMSEVEVSIRLAIYLVKSGKVDSPISIAIDGAQVKTSGTVHFAMSEFMCSQGWNVDGAPGSRWQGVYKHREYQWSIQVHSNAGQGDVTARLRSGHMFVAESKKGPLVRARNSSEYPLIREALGQLLTMESIPDNPFLAVAIPAGERFMELAARWRNAPLVHRAGIHLLTVSQDGDVQGWQ